MHFRKEARFGAVHIDVRDIGTRLRNTGGDATEHTTHVLGYHPEARFEKLPGIGLPLDVNPVLRFRAAQIADRSARMGVDAQPLPLAQQTNDGITGNRPAARRQLDRHAFGAANDQRLRDRRFGLLDFFMRRQTLGKNGGQATPQADIGVDLALRLLARTLNHTLPDLRGNLRRYDAARLQLLIEHVFAQRARPVLLQRLEELADLAARPSGLDVVQPRRVRVGIGRRDDLDLIAVRQLGRERDQFMVDPRRHAAMADVGMHGVGEVDDRRAARQRQNLPFGREDIDLVGKQIDLDVLEKLGRILRRALQFEQRLQPFVHLDLQVGAALLAVLVQPVRSDTLLGQVMHALRADLDLDRRAVRADQRRMQRLVAVTLRDCDVVLELPRHRLVARVQRAQRQIATRHILDDHPEAVDIQHLREAEMLV